MSKALLLSLLVVSGIPAGLAPCSAAFDPITVELRGNTRTWTETAAVFETTEDSKFQTERYGKRFSYALTGLPPGPARLKLGFCEFKFRTSGKRVFDILANGKVIFDGFDILARGRPREAVIVAASVSIPEGDPFVLQLISRLDNAKFNWLKLYTDEWAVEVLASDRPELLIGKPDGDAPYMNQAYETCIGKFGSRICINPRPQRGVCRQGPLGHADYNVAYFERDPELYEDPPTAMYYAVRCGDVWRSLPFNGRIPPFTRMAQEQTLTSLAYTCRAPDLPLEVTYTFRAPFYPGDVRLCVAPYILLDVSVRNLTAGQQTGAVIIGQSLRPVDTVSKASGSGCAGLICEAPVFGKRARQAWLVDEGHDEGVTSHAGDLAIPAATAADAAQAKDADGRTLLATTWADAAAGFAWEFSLAPRETASRTFAYVGWVDGEIIRVMGEPYHFKYTELFTDLFDVARFAFDNREEIDKKVALFESTVQDATAPQALKEFLAFAFQSWVQNTFYCSNAEFGDWFSVWEGCCKFHSTVDVEYNVAPLYFEYWPELMKMTLRQWTWYIRNGILSHDMGMGLAADGMVYGHDMEVEENTNFVLLLHRYWRLTGDAELVAELFTHVDELLAHVQRCDTDGDGFHEKGTYNTIDQGSKAIQYAQDQTYLAVRALCAYECGAKMAQALNDDAKAQQWRDLADATAATLQEQAWLDDHYVVALNQQPQPDRGTTGGDWNTGVPATGGFQNWHDPGGQPTYDERAAQPSYSTYQPVQGWDAYSIYATNGMLYPMRSGLELPGIDIDRLRRDLLSATFATLKKYGCPHTSRESNMWVSQNIWRDMAAAYLGIDMLDNIDRYWALQKYINREKRGCFTDVFVYGSNHISLDYYPRGVAAFGLIPAMTGLQVDKVLGRVSVAPLRTPLRIPLLAYADWSRAKVPWLTIVADGEAVGVAVEGDVPVDVTTRPVGKPW